ncbi:LysR family transcriptional regulator [Bordetella trematum]|nr:LysR family transcriptional regulator [Bordetella trematum]
MAAGYGAALLPQEAAAPQPDARIAMRPLRPALWRPLGLAHRAGPLERATGHVLHALQALRQR